MEPFSDFKCDYTEIDEEGDLVRVFICSPSLEATASLQIAGFYTSSKIIQNGWSIPKASSFQEHELQLVSQHSPLTTEFLKSLEEVFVGC